MIKKHKYIKINQKNQKNIKNQGCNGPPSCGAAGCRQLRILNINPLLSNQGPLSQNCIAAKSFRLESTWQAETNISFVGPCPGNPILGF